MLEDDLLPFFEKVKEADAVVLGSSLQMGTVNATMLSFLSRFFGFRHVTIPIKNKPFVLAVCGLGLREGAESRALLDFERALMPFQVNIVDAVKYSSRIPPCFKCGRIQECRIGGAYHIWGEEAHTMEITQDRFRRWEDDPETRAHIDEAARKLRDTL
jgi:multimeric flavodoxin WrbA